MVKDRMAVLTAMMDIGLIPIFNHPDVEVCTKVIQACANGGGDWDWATFTCEGGSGIPNPTQ